MTVGELREALRKWDSGLDVRTKVGEEFYEFDDMDIYMNDFGRVAIDIGYPDRENEIDELQDEIYDLEGDIEEKDDVIDNAYNEAIGLKNLLDESKEPDMNEVRRLVKQIVAILT